LTGRIEARPQKVGDLAPIEHDDHERRAEVEENLERIPSVFTPRKVCASTR